MIIALEKIVGILLLKDESYQEFIQRVNKYGRDAHASRIEVTQFHFTPTAILYRKYGIDPDVDDTPSKEEAKI